MHHKKYIFSIIYLRHKKIKIYLKRDDLRPLMALNGHQAGKRLHLQLRPIGTWKGTTGRRRRRRLHATRDATGDETVAMIILYLLVGPKGPYCTTGTSLMTICCCWIIASLLMKIIFLKQIVFYLVYAKGGNCGKINNSQPWLSLILVYAN